MLSTSRSQLVMIQTKGIEERRSHRIRYNHYLTAAVLLKSYQIFFLDVFSIPFHSIRNEAKRETKAEDVVADGIKGDDVGHRVRYTHINHATHTVTHHIKSHQVLRRPLLPTISASSPSVRKT